MIIFLTFLSSTLERFLISEKLQYVNRSIHRLGLNLKFAKIPQVSDRAGQILLTNGSLYILQKQVYDLIGGLWRKVLSIVETIKIEGNDGLVA